MSGILVNLARERAKRDLGDVTFDYKPCGVKAPEAAPLLTGSPLQTIGYWCDDILHHGPVVRFWSFTSCSNLVSFVDWNALALRGIEVLKELQAAGAALQISDRPAARMSMAEWCQKLILSALEARVLGDRGDCLLTVLPEGLEPPSTIVTLRPEVTTAAWMDARTVEQIKFGAPRAAGA